MNQTIVVNTNQKKNTISRHIYGHFAEHLGRCIYGGFWVGKDSPIENIDGYRTDVLKAFKEIKIPNLRWPGGCFADEYHWKDGIGPQNQRKRMVNTHWGGVVEDNSFGTHEFLGLCEQLECDPYICGNVGSGTVQEMSEWVEYITFSGESPMSRLRQVNGHKDNWKLPFFGVGNESWGCGGNMRPEYYADLYRHYQTYVRQYGPDKIFKIACGPNVDDYNWTQVLMETAGKFMDGLSLHHYTFEKNWDNKGFATDFEEEAWYTTLENAFFMEDLVRNHSQIMDKYDKEKRIALVVDEWGCWHKVEPGTNPGFLYQQNSMRDALVAGITLNIFNNYSQRVRIANIAQAVNVLQSPVLTEGDKIVLTPTWHVFNMYKNHQEATLLEVGLASGLSGMNNTFVPSISASASEKDGNYLVTVCNTDLHEKKNITVEFTGLDFTKMNIKGQTIEGETMTSFNSFDCPDAVTTKDLTCSATSKNSVSLVLPPRSISSVYIYG